MIARTTALSKIEKTIYEPTFYKVIQGGMSSSKTFSIMILLIGYAESYDNSLITVAGMSYNHLATGAMRDFKRIMRETNRWDDSCFNKSAKIYTFLNGSQLEFLSTDNMTSRGPRRDVLFVNEANGLDVTSIASDFKPITQRVDPELPNSENQWDLHSRVP